MVPVVGPFFFLAFESLALHSFSPLSETKAEEPCRVAPSDNVPVTSSSSPASLTSSSSSPASTPVLRTFKGQAKKKLVKKDIACACRKEELIKLSLDRGWGWGREIGKENAYRSKVLWQPREAVGFQKLVASKFPLL